MCTLHPFTAQYMRAPCHERCITKMMSKQLTSLNILGLYLHLGSTEGYYNKDAKDYARACYICQRVGKPSQRDEIPLAL
jgi:hypothetical protein